MSTRQIARDNDKWWWVEWEISEGWMAAERLRVVPDGRVLAVELRIFPDPNNPFQPSLRGRTREPGTWYHSLPVAMVPWKGVTARLLRTVRSERLPALRQFAKQHPQLARANGFGGIETTPTRATASSRKGLFFYALVASDYAALLKSSRSPVTDLALRRRVKVPEMKRWVYQAREYGLLTRNDDQHGRAGGKLTPKAIRVLRKGAPNAK